MEIQWTREDLNVQFYALDNTPVTGLQNMQAALGVAAKIQSALQVMSKPIVDAAAKKVAETPVETPVKTPKKGK